MVGVEGHFKPKRVIVIDLFPRTYTNCRYVPADGLTHEKALDSKIGGTFLWSLWH